MTHQPPTKQVLVLLPGTAQKHIVNLHDIICLKGEGRYTHVYIADSTAATGWKVLMACITLKAFERCLHRNFFVRVSKCFIVGLLHLVALQTGNEIQLRYNCCPGITLSPKFRRQFHRHFIQPG